MMFPLLLAGLLALLFTGLPIFAGLSLFSGGVMLATQGEVGAFAEVVFGKLNAYLLVSIPLFTLMAHVMIRGKVVDDLYDAAYTLTRHLPGGVGIATVFACTIFAAISGSSVATVLTIGTIAIPQMIRFGYPPHIAYGVVAGGGTLGILIPPSSPMVLYGVVSDTSIGKLFVAGVVPGLMMALIFAIWCAVQTSVHPGRVRREPRASLVEIVQAVRRSFWALVLPAGVLGGMYAGLFTATEAAAAGAFAAILIASLAYRSFGATDLWRAALDTCRTSAMLFMILAAAEIFSHVLTLLRIPQDIVALTIGHQVGPVAFLMAVMALIFVLGMFLETISIILITTPVVLPVMTHLEIDPVWYGILLVINLEVALLTPPVGLNLFTIKAISRAPMADIVRGSLPYVALLLLGLGLVMAFPQLALWLPRTMAS